MIVHPLEPIIDKNCEVLILGSFPSVKSREVSFYYGHPQNRFWKIIGIITQTPYETIEDKKKMLLDHHIAIWDIIHSCTIQGSSDASIKDVVPNDISKLIEGTHIKRIYCNGGTSLKLYKKYQEKEVGIKAMLLPSSSPANARYRLDDLVEIWNKKLTL